MHCVQLVFAFAAFAISWVSTTAADDHAGHDHDESNAWEWSGIFPFSTPGHYVWTAEKAEGGDYADASMKMLILPASGESAANLDAAAHEAEEIWNTSTTQPNWTAVTSGGGLQPGVAYRLDFDSHSWMSMYEIDIPSAGAYAFFCEHFPIEFETNVHFLKTETGVDVEPTVQMPETATPAPAELDKWGEVFIGSFLTVVPTLVGIALVVPFLMKMYVFDELPAAVNAFASGVLFSAAIFLLLPEAHHLTGADQTEVTSAWTWGTGIMAGWLVCVGMHHVSGIVFPQGGSNVKTVGVAGGEQGGEEQPASWGDMIAISGPVLFGDFMHNFSDGIVIGVAFKSCNTSFAWTLIGATIAHEIPQELADFVVLVKKARMKWYWALLFNFLSGLSTVIGALIFYGVEVNQMFEGVCLAFGGGVYLYVAVTELGLEVTSLSAANDKPEAEKEPPCIASLKRLAGFALGAIAIGLVLLGHEHCAGDDLLAGAVDPHAGHNH